MYMFRAEQKSWSIIPTGLETKNYCAGEGQQQFNRPTGRACNWNGKRNLGEKTEGDECAKWIEVRKNGSDGEGGRKEERNGDKMDKGWKRNAGERREGDGNTKGM
jgi:hypothetical protein